MKLVPGNEIRETLSSTRAYYTIKRALYWFLKLVCNTVSIKYDFIYSLTLGGKQS
jgi:hypothetical protein